MRPGPEEREAAARLGARVILLGEPGYPDLLAAIPDPPEALYVRGRLEAEGAALAFVGSRRPSHRGLRAARRLAGEAARSGHPVVSGLARGIDAEAHRAALEAGGATWAVLGSGLDRVYPPEHARLAERIVEAGGAVLSELPPGSPPLPGHFPMRNRIVSGLSWAVVVVEGKRRSGSLITARLAAEQGREVFAVPGPEGSPLSEAPNWLLAQGAKPVDSLAELWPELPPGCRPSLTLIGSPERAEAPEGLAEEAEKIVQYMGSEPRSLEELGRASGLDIPRLSGLLMELELKDLVEALPGQRYAKKGA